MGQDEEVIPEASHALGLYRVYASSSQSPVGPYYS